MGLLTSLLTGSPLRATYGPTDEFWYRPISFSAATEAGIAVTPELSMRLSAVYACVGLLADMVGTLPLHLYRRRDDGGKERAIASPLYALLHQRPNAWQTSKEWRALGMMHLLLRGNFVSELITERGVITELRPLHPDRLRITTLANGRRGYLYRPPQGPPRALTQDDVLHVMGLSLDGVIGCSVIEYAREAVGAAVAQQGFASRFWAQGAEGHLAFVAPNAMSAQTREANEKAIQARLGGWQNAHKAILLEGGLKPERISVTGRDSQYIESRKFSVADIARFFRVPGHMIGDVDSTSSWGAGVEQQTIGFVNFTLMPWLVAFEQAVGRDVIDDQSLFAEFLVDALLRGESGTRATAHRQYVDGGIKSVNEVRVIENLNPLDGDEFERPHRAGNLGGVPGGGDPATTANPPMAPRRSRPVPEDDDDEDNAQARHYAGIIAGRLVHREIAEARKLLTRLAAEPPALREQVAVLYGRLVESLERELRLKTVDARRYGAEHCAILLERGEPVLAEWEREAPAALVTLALGASIARR